jgi:predicted ATPase/class 3 adenylate cyclase/DNA-binding CsgD family transcriptional regulator
VAELAPKREHLSRRERQIAEAYAAGRNHREIAERLFIAPATVRTHLGAIYRKLGVSTKIELLRTLATADGPDAEAGVEAFAPSPQTAREPRADPLVTELLRKLDLHQYADVFAANAVDMDVLMTLTESDLRELGVQAIGHRRRLLDAIHERRSDNVGADGGERSAAAEVPAPATRPPGERRHLTIAFVDLAGSMEPPAQLDPELMHELLAEYQKAVANEAARFQGHLASVMGDEILASFGWPNAHEDDAERAVRAALAIRAAIEALRGPQGNPLAVRIGIASGLVVVGERTSHEAVLAGDAPNLASRLRAIASQGQIVIAESTRRLLGDIFELADLGTKSGRGMGEPVQAFAVIHERSVESRFDARSGAALLPMVGRDQELALLLERWVQAEAGEGQGVLLVGEAGIGKSRIAHALLDAVAEEPHTRIRYQCSPYHIDSVLWPVTQQLTHAAGSNAADPDDAKLDKLEALLRKAGDHAVHAAPLIAELIGFDGTTRYAELDLTPQAQRARTLAALVDQLLGLAEKTPVLVVLEDAHWIDPTTLELVEQCLDRIADRRVLILVTSRPDDQPRLAAYPHVTRLALNRLARPGVEAIVARLDGDRLPLATRDTIIARTDGVPLFVEELTKTVLESGLLTDSGDRYALAGPQPPLAIPATLQDSLMARIDRLGPAAKEVAQVGAAIGREFSHELLAAVARQSEAEQCAALDRLTDAGLVFRRGGQPTATFLFKHALVQDAAYGTLLRGPRQALHARIAAAMEERFPETVEMQPELLARHCAEAGFVEKAAGYCFQAGKSAAARSANLEAIAHLRRGLEAVGRFPDGPAKDRTELDLRLALGPCLMATEGPAGSSAVATFARARELAERLGGDRPEQLSVLHWLAVGHALRGELPQAREALVALLERAQARGDRPAIINAARSLGLVHLVMGAPVEAKRLTEQAVAAFDASGEAERLATHAAGQDAGAAGLAALSWALWALGEVDTAAARIAAALRRADAIEHPHTQAYCCYYASVLYALRGEPAVALGHAQRCLALSEEHGFRQWSALSRAVRGICTARLDASSGDAPEEARDALDRNLGAGYRFGITALCMLLGAVLLDRGDIERAQTVIAQGCLIASHNSERLFEAELCRLNARALLVRGEPDTRTRAQSLLEMALATARSQSARALELRAATSLARLWRDEGRAKARALLAPVYGGFTEGFATADLKDAKALLDELR